MVRVAGNALGVMDRKVKSRDCALACDLISLSFYWSLANFELAIQ